MDSTQVSEDKTEKFYRGIIDCGPKRLPFIKRRLNPLSHPLCVCVCKVSLLWYGDLVRRGNLDQQPAADLATGTWFDLNAWPAR